MFTFTKKGRLKKSIEQLKKNTATQIFLEEIQPLIKEEADKHGVNLKELEVAIQPHINGCIMGLHEVMDSATKVHEAVEMYNESTEKMASKIRKEAAVDSLYDRYTEAVKSTVSRMKFWGRKKVDENRGDAGLVPANA